MLGRRFALSVLFLTAFLATGCTSLSIFGGGDATAGEFEASAVAPQSASVGDAVQLTARVTDGAGAVTYKWYQTAGREVELIGADSDTLTFYAPSLPLDQRLAFRVESTNAAGVTSTAEVFVTVRGDPNYSPLLSVGGAGGGSGGGGSGGGSGGDGSTGGSDFPRVRLKTNFGDIVLELNALKAPITVKNFLQYVDDGFYDDTAIHRVVKDFVIQGGGYSSSFEQKKTRSGIKNEAGNGLKNLRGTVGMARLQIAGSATSQFYINLTDNPELDRSDQSAGYAIFGKVVEGLSVVDAIGALEISEDVEHHLPSVPTTPVTVLSADREPS
jgi:cyclophilin family peptidyl-prolyl cis-trans isomerase